MGLTQFDKRSIDNRVDTGSLEPVPRLVESGSKQPKFHLECFDLVDDNDQLSTRIVKGKFPILKR
jgi:hypothetical protein